VGAIIANPHSHHRKMLLPPFLNIYRFDLFTLTLTICLITKIKFIKYILKLYYVINYIVVKIYNNYKFNFK
jgi:hypothetical protein